MNALMLFAQQNKFGQQPPPGGGGDAAAAAGFFILYMVAIGIFGVVMLVLQILFLMSLSKCLAAVSSRNRKMEPGQVWLNLIPFFNYVWLILTILRVSESLENEYESRGLRGDGDFGKMMGIMYYVSMFVCFCVTPILLILYWMKIAGYTKALTEGGGGSRSRSRARDDDYDDDDDRPRRRRRDEDDEDDR
jgi:hypothetical protein